MYIRIDFGLDVERIFERNPVNMTIFFFSIAYPFQGPRNIFYSIIRSKEFINLVIIYFSTDLNLLFKPTIRLSKYLVYLSESRWFNAFGIFLNYSCRNRGKQTVYIINLPYKLNFDQFARGSV